MGDFGFSEMNPIKLKDSESVLIILDDIVTENGFHLLYHFLDYIVKGDLIIERYEVFSEEKGAQILYFDVTNDKNSWIAPVGFIFSYDWIIDVDIIYHGQDYYYKDDRNDEDAMAKFDSIEHPLFDFFLFENVGVNFKSQNFPHSMFQKYLDEHTFTKDED